VTQYPLVTGEEFVAALRRAGFAVARVKGSGHIMRHTDRRITVVPVHAGESIGQGLLPRILRRIDLDLQGFAIEVIEHIERTKAPTRPRGSDIEPADHIMLRRADTIATR
jgi:predicted RNA binding protein YcfA (HicA-like mRNA interferase family)